MVDFDFNPTERSEAWNYLLQQLEAYYSDSESLPVSPGLNQEEIKGCVNQYSLNPSRDGRTNK